MHKIPIKNKTNMGKKQKQKRESQITKQKHKTNTKGKKNLPKMFEETKLTENKSEM